MKDYESYRNNGNKDIADNPNLKKLDVYPRYQESNILPGEYFDIRENALDCAIDDDDNYAYDSSESGSAETKSAKLDDVKDLTNVANPTANASIVESAGSIVTGTATVVVGGAAAVVAFNAISKAKPTMKINFLDSGSSYVHYNIVLNNLEKDKDYDIVVRNSQHTFRIDCRDGINDDYVYNLKPGLQYSLSLVSYHELLGEVEYASETFYTLKSGSVLGNSNIEIIYNDDLTCGIKYDTTLIDDKNKTGETYVVVKVDTGMSGGDGEWEIFNSLYAEDYMREEPDKFTYEYKDKVHKGTIKEIPVEAQKIIVELYKVGSPEEKEGGELISSTSKEVAQPFIETNSSNYIRFTGDYNLIKEIKKINIKKDNLVAKITLYNDNDEETKFEKDIDISTGLFDIKTLVKQDTTGYSYQIGYYKADKSFVVVKEKEESEFYNGYYGAYYDDVYGNYEQMIAKWNYDEEGNETLDLTLLTDFDNYGNDDCYYKVELFRATYNDQTQGEFELIDTYIGTGVPTFKNLPTRELDQGRDEYYPIYYGFKYTSLMNYYDEENGKETVEFEVRDHTDWTIDFAQQFDISRTQFRIRGDGKYFIPFDVNMESSYAGQLQYKEGNLKLYFYKSYNADPVIVETKANIEVFSSDLLLVFDAELPTDMMELRITCDLPYEGMFNEKSSVRRLIIEEPFSMGDIYYSAAFSTIKYSVVDDIITGTATAYAYIPSGGYVAAIHDNGDAEYERLTSVNGLYTYNFTDIASGQYVRFVVFDENGYQLTDDGHYVSDYVETEIDMGRVSINKTDGNYHTVMTYNDDGTVNIYCLTGLNYEDNYGAYGPSEYKVDCYLQRFDYETGGYVDVGSVKNITREQPIAVFEHVPYVSGDATYNIRYDVTYINDNYYDAARQEITAKVCEFQLVESNIGSLHPNGQLVGYNMYDEDLGQNIISLTIPAGMIYDKDQTITFTGSFDGDEWTPITVKLSDYLTSSTSDGDIYVFDIDPTYVEQAENKDAKIMYNYTLTEDNYNQIKDIYSGSLYKEYSILITSV